MTTAILTIAILGLIGQLTNAALMAAVLVKCDQVRKAVLAGETINGAKWDAIVAGVNTIYEQDKNIFVTVVKTRAESREMGVQTMGIVHAALTKDTAKADA